MKLHQLIKSVIVTTSLFFIGAAQAAQTSKVIPYYGAEFYSDLGAGASGDALIQRIKTVLRSYHQTQANDLDKIVASCDGSQGKCYSHHAIGYNAARVWLMGGYYLKQDGSNYAVWDVYCNDYKDRGDFKGNAPAPGTIPNNTVVNVEHTWPQSRFTRKFPDDVQKSDLHHLFPADSKLNSIRGNNWFGEVTKDTVDLSNNGCPNSGSRYGVGSAGGEEIFEPPTAHKGHVARALFYFALRYDLHIDQEEEAILKKWNRENPVDEDEARRNNEIFKAQGNRNPFVDYPELADKIADF